MKTLTQKLVWLVATAFFLLLSVNLHAQTSLSALDGEFKLNGTYPNGQFYGKWRIQASDRSIDIYEWKSVGYYQKNWVRMPIQDASFDGYNLQFTVKKNLAGSWITEVYRIRVSYGNRISGTISVNDSFLDDAGIGYTEQLLGMSLGTSSSYKGSLTLVRQ